MLQLMGAIQNSREQEGNFHHYGSPVPSIPARGPLQCATHEPLGQPWHLGTSEKGEGGANMLHLIGGIQNSREHEGDFPPLWVPHTPLPLPGGRSNAQPRHLWGSPGI